MKPYVFHSLIYIKESNGLLNLRSMGQRVMMSILVTRVHGRSSHKESRMDNGHRTRAWDIKSLI